MKKPGVLQSMGLQRGGLDLAIEQQIKAAILQNFYCNFLGSRRYIYIYIHQTF